tara:strand:+ start:6128 stop:6580 length:453 start_codon:yes stop_codon:yes gene_type:complete
MYSNNKKQILKKFILEFFTPTGNKRKNSGNELNYLHSTLDRVFIQNFGFNLDRAIVATTFTKLGFQVFQMNSTFNSETKRVVPSKDGEFNDMSTNGSKRFEAPFTYFDISPVTVRLLMKTTAKLSDNTNESKKIETRNMKQKIEELKKRL